jgi:hypothetical protein
MKATEYKKRHTAKKILLLSQDVKKDANPKPKYSTIF